MRHGAREARGLNAEGIPRASEKIHVRARNWKGEHVAGEVAVNGLVFTDGSAYPCVAQVGCRAGWAVVVWDRDPDKTGQGPCLESLRCIFLEDVHGF